jgi:hypothetical protein
MQISDIKEVSRSPAGLEISTVTRLLVGATSLNNSGEPW